MPIIDNTRLLGAFFHWLGKVNTFDGNYAGNEKYKSSHNVRSSEVWMDDIPFAPNFASASYFSDLYPGIIRKVGTVSSVDGDGNNLSGAPGYLYPLDNTVYQSWFLDTGTPSLMPNGQFIPSNEWVKPLINSTDVPDESGKPSNGYSVKLYRPNTNGTFNVIPYNNAGYEIDYFSGIFRFQAGKTPIDPASNSGLAGYQMSQAGFESAASSGQLAAINFIKGNTGGIRAIAYQYVGQTLNTFTGGVTGATGPMGATGATGPAGSNGTSGTSGYAGDKYRTQTTDSISISSANTILSFTVSNSLSYTQNQIVIISYDGANYMYGTVSGYNPVTGTMSVVVSDFAGSGSYTDWTVNLFGAAGGDGSSGTSGTSGTSGQDGTSGTSGTEGTSGTSGTTGTSGTSGTSGTEGTSGTSGQDGTSGTSGQDGTSGTSGQDGTSGSSGTTGTSGTSGYAGDKYRYVYGSSIDISTISVNSTYTYTVGSELAYSPAQSIIISYDNSNYIRGTVSSYTGGVLSIQVSEKQGTANDSGFVFNLDGASGGDGSSGTSGTSGTSGQDGTSGTSGQDGTSGTSGTSGIGIPAGGSASWVLVKKTDTDYDTEWLPNSGGGGGSPLTVEDYLTGATYGNINNIIFRGNTVLVPGGTATGVLVTDDEPVTPGSIIVWIPAPTYAPYFSPSLSTGNQNRYVMKPTSNALSGSNPGEYSIGDWDIPANFNADTTRSVRTTSGAAYQAFSNATSFSCNTNTTSLEFIVYKGDAATIAATMSATINTNATVTDGPLSITITDFAADNDRFKAKASGTINLATLFPYGGRFSWMIRHVNPGAPGNPLTFNSQQLFYDIDLAFDSDSSADISGTAAFEEKTPSLKYYSGVAHYGMGSSFGFTVSGIDNLNDITIPASKQADISINNMAISGPLNGYADGTKAYGTVITGWTYSWNISGLTFSRTGTVDQSSQYIPGFASTANNLLNSSIFSSIDARLYDDGQADMQSSDLKSMLFDTYTPGGVTHLSNPVDSENGRLSFSGLSNVEGKGAHPSSGIHSGSATFSSLTSLNDATDELQYIFGRIIYPQENFTAYRPLTNSGANVNYFQNSGSASVAFNVYNYAGLWENTGTYDSVTLPGFRWYVTSYTKDAGMSGQIFNAFFTFASNFIESDMAEGYNGSAYILNPQPSLAILVGIDSTNANSSPDKFLYLSGSAVTYGARVGQIDYNFNSSTKRIKFDIGPWGNSVNVRKVWLFVGFNIYSSRGKNLWLSDVQISYPTG